MAHIQMTLIFVCFKDKIKWEGQAWESNQAGETNAGAQGAGETK